MNIVLLLIWFYNFKKKTTPLKSFLPLLIFFLLSATPLPLFAAPSTDSSLPLWELRVAATAARLPHYKGSDEYKNYFFPLPYLIYRGDFFQADRDNIRTIFYKNSKLETDISMWGNPPVPGDNRAREGMEDLDALLEIGPALRYYFRRDGISDGLYLKGAVRSVFSVGWDGGPDIHYQGLHSDIYLIFKNNSLFAAQQLRFHLSTGLHFGDATFNEYFYEVGEKDAVPGRNMYSAGGGYSGFSLAGSLVKRFTPTISFGCYGRWDNISGAEYEDSPLAKEMNNYTIGAMFIFTLAQSERLLP